MYGDIATLKSQFKNTEAEMEIHELFSSNENGDFAFTVPFIFIFCNNFYILSKNLIAWNSRFNESTAQIYKSQKSKTAEKFRFVLSSKSIGLINSCLSPPQKKIMIE